MHSKLNIDHRPASSIFLQGEYDPVTIAVTFVGVEGNVVFGEDVKFVVHQDGDVTLVIEGGTAPQMVQMHSPAAQPFPVRSHNGHHRNIVGHGNIFETFIINELYKRIYHLGEKPQLHFWRDKTGNEVDLILDKGRDLIPVEIKSSMTYDRSLKSGLSKWLGLKNNMTKKGFVLYRGDEIVGRNAEITVVPWWTF